MSEKKYRKKLVNELIEDIELAQSFANGMQTGYEDMLALNKLINILSKIKHEVEKLDGLFISMEDWDKFMNEYNSLYNRQIALKDLQQEIEEELDMEMTLLNWKVNREVIKVD